MSHRRADQHREYSRVGGCELRRNATPMWHGARDDRRARAADALAQIDTAPISLRPGRQRLIHVAATGQAPVPRRADQKVEPWSRNPGPERVHIGFAVGDHGHLRRLAQNLLGVFGGAQPALRFLILNSAQVVGFLNQTMTVPEPPAKP